MSHDEKYEDKGESQDARRRDEHNKAHPDEKENKERHKQKKTSHEPHGKRRENN